METIKICQGMRIALGVKDGAILFINPYATSRYDTRSVFKRSTSGLNLVFFFS